MAHVAVIVIVSSCIALLEWSLDWRRCMLTEFMTCRLVDLRKGSNKQMRGRTLLHVVSLHGHLCLLRDCASLFPYVDRKRFSFEVDCHLKAFELCDLLILDSSEWSACLLINTGERWLKKAMLLDLIHWNRLINLCLTYWSVSFPRNRNMSWRKYLTCATRLIALEYRMKVGEVNLLRRGVARISMNRD